jgi:hypothetical protein
MIYYPSVLGAGQLMPHGSVDCKRTQTSSHCLRSTSTVTSPPLSILCLRTQFGQRSNLGVGTNQPPREHLRIHSPTPLLLALVRVFRESITSMVTPWYRSVQQQVLSLLVNWCFTQTASTANKHQNKVTGAFAQSQSCC